MDISEEDQRLLKSVVDHFDQEDRAVRERQIRKWKKLKYYWEGYQRIWWSETAHDYRIDTVVDEGDDNDAEAYDKQINIFKAMLETIVAALSVTIPPVKCAPDDADNPLDISTARAGDKIAELIYKHNNVPLLWIHALYIYCTEGLIAAYNYSKEDKSYGTYNKAKYNNDETKDQQVKTCPNCKQVMSQEDLSEDQEDKFNPDDEDATVDYLLDKEGNICNNCMQQVDPIISTEKIIVPRLIGYTKEPKSRQCIEVYGGLFVKVAVYAKKQEDTPYLIKSYETHYSAAIERFKDLKDKFSKEPKIGPGTGGLYDPYEKWGRLSTQYLGEFPINTCTVREAWLRCSAFNILREQDDITRLRKKFPDGCKVTFVNDQFAEACNESLDDCWTLTHNPLSDYLHHDPAGAGLISIQDITNDLVQLVLQTIEHGIPQTFYDPNVLDGEAYKNSETSPGMLYPTKQTTGKAISDGFYEVKTATLSPEVQPFMEKVQEAGQMVSGALPSLFGGAQPNSSKTAAQYSMSRAQALQRLQTPWKMLTFWWKDIFGKVIPAYIDDVVEDERVVQKDKSGNFVNVFIRKSELLGKIGSIELEASDQLPISWQQKKDAIMQLLQAGNQEVMAALTQAENIDLIKQAIGIDDFVIPGEDDRIKQYEEIKQLTDSGPIPNAQGGMGPSVDIEPLVDNHQVEADICRKWLVSDAGRLCKIENPNGYKNVLLHMQAHMSTMQQQSATQSQGKPAAINFNFKGEDLVNPQVAQEFSKVSGTQPAQVSNQNPAPGAQPIAAPIKGNPNASA